jgi:hypothetical protein
MRFSRRTKVNEASIRGTFHKTNYRSESVTHNWKGPATTCVKGNAQDRTPVPSPFVAAASHEITRDEYQVYHWMRRLEDYVAKRTSLGDSKLLL